MSCTGIRSSMTTKPDFDVIRCMTETFQYHLCSTYLLRIVRVSGCPVVVAQWQSTGCTSQELWPVTLAFSLSFISPHDIFFNAKIIILEYVHVGPQSSELGSDTGLGLEGRLLLNSTTKLC